METRRAQAENRQVRKSANQESAERDGLIEDVSGLFWSWLLVRMGIFPSDWSARKALRRLHSDRLIRRVGQFDVTPNQNPAQVFTSSERTIKRDTIVSHEVPLSKLLAPYYRFADEIRGPYGVDPKTLPDREMVIGDVTYRWEYYTGKQDLKQLVKRLKKYIGTDDPILAVCKKARYIEKVRKAAEEAGVQDLICYAICDEVLKDPYGPVFATHAGDKVPITLPATAAATDPE